MEIRNLHQERSDVKRLISQLIDLKEAFFYATTPKSVGIHSVFVKYNNEQPYHTADNYTDNLSFRLLLVYELSSTFNSPHHSKQNDSDIQAHIRAIQEAIYILRSTYQDIDSEKLERPIKTALLWHFHYDNERVESIMSNLYGYKRETWTPLGDAMTTTEIEETYNLSAGTVRQYTSNHKDEMMRRGVARKSGSMWLISRFEAKRIWGHRK